MYIIYVLKICVLGTNKNSWKYLRLFTQIMSLSKEIV